MTDAVERAAEAIYNLFPYDDPRPTPEKPPWEPNGNSLKQDEARRYAKAALAPQALAATPAVGVEDDPNGYRSAWLELSGLCNKLKEENFNLRAAQPASPLRGREPKCHDTGCIYFGQSTENIDCICKISITEDELTRLMDEAWPDGHRVMARKIMARLSASPPEQPAARSGMDQVKRGMEEHQHIEPTAPELPAARPMGQS